MSLDSVEFDQFLLNCWTGGWNGGELSGRPNRFNSFVWLVLSLYYYAASSTSFGRLISMAIGK